MPRIVFAFIYPHWTAWDPKTQRLVVTFAGSTPRRMRDLVLSAAAVWGLMEFRL